MKYARNIEARVFCREDEDHSKIEHSLRSIFPFVLEDQKILLERKSATGFENKKITILKVRLEKDRHCNVFLKKFLSSLTPEQKAMLSRQLDSRLDDDLNFYIRIDKKKLLENGETWITDSGNCIHIRIGVAAFPSNKASAKEVCTRMLALDGNRPACAEKA